MDRRVARTKKNIYYAFFQLVQTKAIDEITVSELARAADIDRKTFYLHYQTVQDVFVEFKQMIHDRLLEILSEAERRGRENQEKLDAGEDWAGWSSDYQASLYAEFVSAGAISLWTDWLHHKQVPLNEFRDSAIEVIREAWKMGTAKDLPYQEVP